MLRLIPFRKHDKALDKKAKQRSQASRKQPKQNVQFHINKRYVTVALVLIALATLVALLPKEQWLPIEKIRIMGEFKQLDTNKLQAQLKPYLGAGFFSVNIQQIQEKVSQQPWISEVAVSRVWPSKILVRVTEKEAFARWDDTHLLSTRAEVFAADSGAFKNLPLINGYQGQSEQLLEKYLSLRKKLEQYGIQLTALHEDSKGAISLLLGDHLKVNLGTEDTEQKINNMLAVYPLQIKPKSDQIQYIDFRYSNGFAIAWKKEDTQKLSDIKRGNKNV